MTTGRTQDQGPDADGPRPTLRVVSGDATPEEIAAVVAAVAAAAPSGVGPTGGDSTGGDPAATGATSVWSAHGHAHRQVRAAFTPGPHGWRTSFWPR